MSQLHVRYEGQSHDVDLATLDVGDASTDAQIRYAVAQHFNVPEQKLAGFTVDKNPETGDITLRPQAVFG